MDSLDRLIETSKWIRSTNSLPVIKKGIVSFSYDKNLSVEEASQTARKKARLEEITRKIGRSHVFYRFTDYTYDNNEIDFVKFNLLIGSNPSKDGIPSMVFTYLNVMQSDLKEISFVVNPISKIILDECRRAYGDFGKTVYIVDELSKNEAYEHLSFRNSFGIKGSGAFKKLSDDELILLVPGDMPFTDQTTINDMIYDSRVIGYDALLDFNFFKNMFDGFPFEYPQRNPHYHVWNPDRTINTGKEPNLFIMNKKVFPYIDYFAKNRKDGNLTISILNLILHGRDCLDERTAYERIRDFIINSALSNEQRLIRRFGAMMTAFKGNHGLIFSSIFDKILNDPTSRLKLVFDASNVYELSLKIAGVKVLLRCYAHGTGAEQNRISHHDFSRVNDLDAPQDYAGFIAPLEYCSANNLPFSYIYRNAEMLQEFEKAMKLLKEHIFFRKHKEIVNDVCIKLGLGYPMFNDDGSLYHHTYRKQEYDVIVHNMLHRYATRNLL